MCTETKANIICVALTIQPTKLYPSEFLTIIVDMTVMLRSSSQGANIYSRRHKFSNVVSGFLSAKGAHNHRISCQKETF